jgi:hypothetical protein
MNRPSSPWAPGSATHRIHDDADDEFADVEDYDAYADDDFDGDYDDVRYYTDHDDKRWLWVASVAGIVLLIAVAGTMMILSGGDSGTTSATVSPSDSRAVPYPSRPRRRPLPRPTRAPSPTPSPGTASFSIWSRSSGPISRALCRPT